MTTSKPAEKPAEKPAGSPVTTATPGAASQADPKGGENATAGNQSTKTVTGAAENSPKPDPDGGKEPEKQISDAELDKAMKEPETPAPGDDDLDRLDEIEATPFADTKVGKLIGLLEKSNTPSNFIIYGYGGVVITLQDLKDLA